MSRDTKKRSGKSGIFGGKPQKRSSRSGSSSNRAGRRARRADNNMDLDQVINEQFGKKLGKKEVRNGKPQAKNGKSDRSRRNDNEFSGAKRRSDDGKQWTEDRRRKSDVRGQKFEEGEQQSERRNTRSDDRRGQSEFGGQRSSRPRNERSSSRQNSNRRNGNNGQGGRGRKKGGRVSQLNDFSLLVKKARSVEHVSYKANRSFEEMPLQPLLKQNLKEKGYEMPSQIQNETLEALLDGHNLVGVANTGTGKTAAFLIPIVERLMIDPLEMAALVVVPTRELALQVEQEFRTLTKGTKLFSSTFIGGTSVSADFKKARRRNHIIIGTPGRLKDMVDRRALRFNRTPVLILDEFDRMLDMGFSQDIRQLVSDMEARTQTMLFSATVEKGQKGIIDELIPEAITVQINSGTTTTDNVEQDIIHVPENGDKFDMLQELIHAEEDKKVLVFTETKRWADKVSTQLNKAGIRSDQIHGDKKQNYRMTALRKFKRGEIKVLVATDVAARGIDVQDVSLVVNYELPMTYDSYIHRIGRTGRAGKTGKAYTFVN